MWGDGQIPYVVDHELAAIERSFEKVVMDSRIYGKPCNPPSWTVVDDVVTCSRGNISCLKKYFSLFCNFRYDSFLVSKLQHGQGHTQDPGPDLQADQSLLQLVWDREGAQSAQDASRGTLGWSSELIMYAICLFVSI